MKKEKEGDIFCRHRKGVYKQSVDFLGNVHFLWEPHFWCKKLKCEGIFTSVEEAKKKCHVFEEERRKVKEPEPDFYV